MRDTDKRARQPFPDTAEPMSPEPMSTVEPIPVDETGLERGGGTMSDAPVIDEQMTDRQMADEQMAEEPMTDEAMADEPVTGRPMADRSATDRPMADEPMFADDVADRLRTRWRELQADFVDDPEGAVRAADDVVDEMMKTIAERRQRLTGEWQGHTDTEELRLALRGYRSFVDTLLPH